MMGIFLRSEVSLEVLVSEAQADPSNDSAAMTEMLSRFEPLAQRIGRIVAVTDDARDDAINAARWGLIQATRAHKPGTSGFPSFAKLYMRGEASRRMRALEDRQSVPTADLSVLDVDHGADRHTDVSVDFGIAISILTPSQRELVARRYVKDEPLGQIASAFGISVSAVSQRLATIHKKLVALQPLAPGDRAAA